MDVNRNQFFLAGMLVVLLGVQFRMVDTFTLTPQVAKAIARKQNRPVATNTISFQSLLPKAAPTPTRTIRPPDWLGYSLISVGAVLILHSLAMKKPEG